MCVTNSDCQAGFRCDSESGQCLPSGVVKDPIKPKVAPDTEISEDTEDQN